MSADKTERDTEINVSGFTSAFMYLSLHPCMYVL